MGVSSRNVQGSRCSWKKVHTALPCAHDSPQFGIFAQAPALAVSSSQCSLYTVTSSSPPLLGCDAVPSAWNPPRLSLSLPCHGLCNCLSKSWWSSQFCLSTNLLKAHGLSFHPTQAVTTSNITHVIFLPENSDGQEESRTLLNLAPRG